MSRLMKITTLLLATLWLPATVHCQLERLGLDAFFACAEAATTEAAHSGDTSCADDGCQTIEAGQIAVAKARLDTAALALLAFTSPFCLFKISAPSPATGFVATAQETTLPLQRTWQFDRRAAAPPRAPGLNA